MSGEAVKPSVEPAAMVVVFEETVEPPTLHLSDKRSATIKFGLPGDSRAYLISVEVTSVTGLLV